jgi:hypothetical protein
MVGFIVIGVIIIALIISSRSANSSKNTTNPRLSSNKVTTPIVEISMEFFNKINKA